MSPTHISFDHARYELGSVFDFQFSVVALIENSGLVPRWRSSVVCIAPVRSWLRLIAGAVLSRFCAEEEPMNLNTNKGLNNGTPIHSTRRSRLRPT